MMLVVGNTEEVAHYAEWIIINNAAVMEMDNLLFVSAELSIGGCVDGVKSLNDWILYHYSFVWEG